MPGIGNILGCHAQPNLNLRCNNHCSSYFLNEMGMKAGKQFSKAEYYCGYNVKGKSFTKMVDFCKNNCVSDNTAENDLVIRSSP